MVKKTAKVANYLQSILADSAIFSEKIPALAEKNTVEYKMEDKTTFDPVLRFFTTRQLMKPGSEAFNRAFCRVLISAARAEAASIWQYDGRERLFLICATNMDKDQREGISLLSGEGITGAVALTRETMSVEEAWVHPQHLRKVDEQIHFRTRSMVSAPIVFNGFFFGVLNVLNHQSGTRFPDIWQERMSVVGSLYAAALTRVSALKHFDSKTLPVADIHRKQTTDTPENAVMVGVSRAIQQVLDLATKAGQVKLPVVIYGDTGTGKELTARRIHNEGANAAGPFVGVNCAALTETLLESELFGHVKGAFSGAAGNRKGKFLAASGGTLFLDEIGEMSLGCQAKILRVLQENRVTPVGSEEEIPCDVRVIAATNQDLEDLIRRRKFREDLFYRLCGMEIRLPHLRNRIEDIPLLLRYFINRTQNSNGHHLSPGGHYEISSQVLDLFQSFSWPGNVRQLEQALQAALAVCESNEISIGDLPEWFHRALEEEKNGSPQSHKAENGGHDRTGISDMDADMAFGDSQEEKHRFLNALSDTCYPGTQRWNLAAAARLLGIPRKTFAYRLKKMNLH